MIEIKFQKKLSGSNGEMFLQVNSKLSEGEIITLYGASGAGKTTTLRVLAGLTTVENGFIKVGDEVWLDTINKINLLPQKRELGFVFQDYALFPNMSVKKNLEFAINNRKDTAFINHLLEITDLVKLADRKPTTLSGGQKQRVALARALVRKPKILLLDEPLSAIDSELRIKLQNDILKFHKEFNLTTILVSHNLSEIFRLSNKVLIIEEGKIVKSGTVSEVFIDKKLSGKFKFEGEVLSIEKNDVVFVVTIAIGNNITKVIATKTEIEQLAIGSKVIVSSKAFNPILLPVN